MSNECVKNNPTTQLLDVLQQILPKNDYISITHNLQPDESNCIPIITTLNSYEYYPNSFTKKEDMCLNWEYQNLFDDINNHPIKGLYTKQQILNMIQPTQIDHFNVEYNQSTPDKNEMSHDNKKLQENNKGELHVVYYVKF